MFRRNRLKLGVVLLVALLVALPILYLRMQETPDGQAQGPIIDNCPIFPADNIWNVPVDTLPVDPNSVAYVNSIGANTGLHPDFGSGTWNGAPIGIPYVSVPSNQLPVPVSFDYDDESDPGPYPIPSNAPIEGGSSSDGDRHVIVVQRGTCKLYETFYSFPQNGGTSWTAGSGAIYNLNSHTLRPAGWTSADAAGLPILPGLARYEEVAAGEIKHALRFTVVNTRNTYVWPARHQASSKTNPAYPPMGQRFRLKASFDTSGYPTQTRIILNALKKYGMIVADNGSNWYISGAPSGPLPNGWDDDQLVSELWKVKGSNFEAVDVSSLMINPNSGQAKVKPDAPSGLLASPFSVSQINLSWTDNSINETGFAIERRRAGGTFSQITTVGAGVQVYNDTGLEDYTQYFYRVRAVNNWGNSAYTTEANATTPLAAPRPPLNVNAWAVSTSLVKLAWDDASHNEQGFKIERSVDNPDNFTEIYDLSIPNSISYTDNSVSNGATYYYRVISYNTAGNGVSANSSKVIATVLTVTNQNDDGAGGQPTMLTAKLGLAQNGESVNFNVSGNRVTFQNGATWNGNIPAGVNLVGSCDSLSGSTLLIDASGLSGGIKLNRSVLYGLKLVNFQEGAGPFLKNLLPGGTGNRLSCVVVKKSE
jgi:hypothetical protein